MGPVSEARRAVHRDGPFLTVAAAIAVVGCLAATVTPIAVGASAAYTGSTVTSGLLGTVFAVQNMRLFRRDGTVALAPSVLTVLFGLWFLLAPLQYDVGLLATAGSQLAGLLVATFAGYMAVSSLASGLR
jgi:hypothetical protein